MRPVYQLKVWQEDGWWLARVTQASAGADPAPLNAITQARSLPKIIAMARDLIATILDTDESDFDVEHQVVLPESVSASVSEASIARACLDVAQDLWHQRSAAAARVLTASGYSLREAAMLLGISHQRVDQILDDRTSFEPSLVLGFADDPDADQVDMPLESSAGPAVETFLIVRAQKTRSLGVAAATEMEKRFKQRLEGLVAAAAERVGQLASAAD